MRHKEKGPQEDSDYSTPSVSNSPAAPEMTDSSSLSNLLLWLVPASLILVSGATVWLIKHRSSPPLPPPPKQLANVETLTVKSRQFIDSLILPARVASDREAEVSSELGGRLDEWLIKEGTVVKESQIIARINTDTLEAELAQLEAAKTSAEKAIAGSEAEVQVAEAGLRQFRTRVSILGLEEKSAEAALELQNREYDRISKLAAQDIATESDLDRAREAMVQAELMVKKAREAVTQGESDVEKGLSQLSGSKAALALNRARLVEAQKGISTLEVKISKSKIPAPITGHFEEFLTEPGEMVTPGLVLGRVYDLTYLRAVVNVPDRYVSFLDTKNPMLEKYAAKAAPGARLGASAHIELPGLPKLTGGNYGGIEFPAVIERIAQASDPLSNTFRVELRFKNPGNALRQGLIVRASVDFLTYPDAVVIPMSSIQMSDDGPRVLVVRRENKKTFATVRNITPASIKNEEILVSKGVSPGDELIIFGGKGIVDGEQVNVIVADGKLVAINEAGTGA